MEILNTLADNITNLDLVICCGKIVGPKGEIDWILEERIELALRAHLQNPNSVLLLTGGVSTTPDKDSRFSEADAMENFIKQNYPHTNLKIIKENNSTGSLNQLCLIKENYVISKNYKKIAIVSDEFHIKRVATLFDAVLGDGYKVYFLGSRINIFGKYRELMESAENKNLEGAEELVKIIPRGDNNLFKNFDDAYRSLRQLRLNSGENRLTYISPQEVLDYMKTPK